MPLYGMPQFYHHLYDAELYTQDEEGCDLPDLAEARDTAMSAIRDFFSQQAKKGKLDFRGHVEITDANGNLVTSVRFKEAFTIVGL